MYQEILKNLRVKKEITQLQLADSLRKPQSFVSKYESGERKLEVNEFISICRALDEPPSSVIRQVEKGIFCGN